jgi:Formiminotransferase domain, N-terminal subdomain
VARPLESVPNFSEGRDRATIDALAEALGSRARLLDVHADEDHNRSVFTLVGSEDEVVEALLLGIACARERIDLRGHEGAHPRIGAADVVPLVPLAPEDLARDWRSGSVVSSGCRSSSTGSSVPAEAPRSSAAAGPRSCSAGSTRASSPRTSARGGSTSGPAGCLSEPAGR